MKDLSDQKEETDDQNSLLKTSLSAHNEPVSTQLTNASNFAIVQNLKRIELNYKKYAASHIELAQTRIEVDELKQQVE